jgi:hypothetical protein
LLCWEEEVPYHLQPLNILLLLEAGVVEQAEVEVAALEVIELLRHLPLPEGFQLH